MADQIFSYEKSDSLQSMVVASERPLHRDGDSTGVGLLGQERHPTESDHSFSEERFL
jgi:hypothetical protein